MRRTSLGLIAAVVALVFAVAAATLSVVAVSGRTQTVTVASPNAERRTVSVTGTGIATLAPDLARFSVGVFEQGKTLTEVQGTVASKTNAILDALRKNGVDTDKDVKTTQYSVAPQFDYPQNRAPVLNGYRVQNSLTVTVRDINKPANANKVGTLLDAAVQAGANLVGNVVFTLADPEAANATARAEAMKNAQTKANALVSGTGAKLGHVVSVSDQTNSPGAPKDVQPMPAAAPASAASAPPTQIQPGDTSVTITVNVTYALE
jgi:uncharacterized protein YggE